jgi:hypothetical protein
MTDKDFADFLNTNEIGVGDFLEIHYNRMYPEVFHGNVVVKDLQFGGRIINTQAGELNLPEKKWYLIVHNNIIGVFGVSAQNVTKLTLLERLGFTSSEYLRILRAQSIKFGDVIVLVDVDKKVQLATMYDSTLQKDQDGDEFFKILNPNGVFNCYLQGLTSIRKGK